MDRTAFLEIKLNKIGIKPVTKFEDGTDYVYLYSTKNYYEGTKDSYYITKEEYDRLMSELKIEKNMRIVGIHQWIKFFGILMCISIGVLLLFAWFGLLWGSFIPY